MAKKKNQVVVASETKSEFADGLKISNGLQEAIFGAQGMFGAAGPQISQVDTLFKNNRWYLITNMRQVLSEIYVEHGIIQTLVNVPVDDGFRGGVTIKTEQLSEEELKKLQVTMKREDDMGVMKEASYWKRLFGGAAILIITDQAAHTPLNMEKLSEDSPLEFKAVDLWELYSESQMADYNDAKFKARPEDDFFMYYGKKVHKSRVIKMKGLKAPSFIRPRLRGWGFSVVESVVRSINQYLKSTDLAFEVLDEHKIDVYKIKGFTQALAAPQGAQKIQHRMQIANQQKNYQNAVVMDAEDDYIQKELAFGGISEIMDGIKKQIASDLRMPLTKIFGISAAGFSSGEDDIENYNAMVESTIRTPAEFDIVRMIEIRCQKMFGMVPDDLEIEFESLRVLGAEAEENVKTSKFQRLLQARQAGEMDSKEFKQACNKHDLLGVQVDENRDTLPSPNANENGEGGAAGKSGKTQAPEAGDAPEAKQSNSVITVVPHVVVVGLINNGYILNGKRRDNGKWTFPGGHLDGAEDPLVGAQREVFEETGIKIKTTDLVEVADEMVTSHRTGKQFKVTAYIASVPERQYGVNLKDPDQEFEVLKWVPISKDTPELLAENRHAKEDFVLRHLFGGVQNSLGYEIAMFSTQVKPMVDDVIPRWRKRQYDNADAEDKDLWSRAKDVTKQKFGEENWQFTIWYYERNGGVFK